MVYFIYNYLAPVIQRVNNTIHASDFPYLYPLDSDRKNLADGAIQGLNNWGNVVLKAFGKKSGRREFIKYVNIKTRITFDYRILE